CWPSRPRSEQRAGGAMSNQARRRVVRWLTLSAVLGALLCAAASTPQPAGEPKLDVRIYTYAQLADFIQKNRGKVILVDMWNLGCIPCYEAMPHVVELHKKYASQGLVVVSLNLNDHKDEETVAEVKMQHAKTNMADA